MSFHNLPKVNDRRAQSTLMQEKLTAEIFSAIQKVEKENNYKFEAYEIDAVLLNRVVSHHHYYLDKKFGPTMRF